MDISIIISGNLTGFSRFYASPNANDIYNEAKFDFDYRNDLSFIKDKEKAYAISFSPKVIAVSLITRILDSFRRPGILVVTALIPRNQLVSGKLDKYDKAAIYKLLNQINDRFHEKNFVKDMINQNPSVLMQDYYSDILAQFDYLNDRMQKTINRTIDVDSLNKRSGYIAASESEMPLYLSSLYRKAYEGYHNVFFAENAPANIDEPAKEDVIYRVKLENEGRMLPREVRLTDKIPAVSPQKGEMPLKNTDFTYKEVLQGDAPDIFAHIEGETIVIKFNFPKEEKTVSFKFFDDAGEISRHVIRPKIRMSDGTEMLVSSDKITFSGKKIYEVRAIESDNPDYAINHKSSPLDLSQYKDNEVALDIYVSKGWTWKFHPFDKDGHPVAVKPVNITLTNMKLGVKKQYNNVTGPMEENLPGNPADWRLKIVSDHYHTVDQPVNERYNLTVKPQQPPYYDRVHSGAGSKSGAGKSVVGSKSGGNNVGMRDNAYSGQTVGGKGGAEEAKEQARIREEQKKKIFFNCVYAVGAILLCVGVYLIYGIVKDKWFPEDPQEASANIVPEDEVLEVTPVAKIFTIKLIGRDGTEIKAPAKDKVQISFTPQNAVSEEDGKYKLTYNSDKADSKLTFEVSYVGCDLLDNNANNTYTYADIPEEIEFKINLMQSEINLYDKLNDRKKPFSLTDYNQIKTNIGNIKDANINYFNMLSELLEYRKPESSSDSNPVEREGEASDPTNDDSWVNPNLDDLGLTLTSLERCFGDAYKSTGSKDRIKSLKDVLKGFKEGKVPESTKELNLSTEQMGIVSDLINLKSRIDSKATDDDKEKFYSALKNKISLKKITDLTKEDSYYNVHYPITDI